jgi:hypothetical protein
MSASVTPSIADKIGELEKRIQQMESVRGELASPAPPMKPPSLWLTNLLQGVTLVTVMGAAFWLGSLSSTVSATATKVDKLVDAVSGTSRYSLTSRITVIQTKLDVFETKLDVFETKLGVFETKLGVFETKLDAIDRKPSTKRVR